MPEYLAALAMILGAAGSGFIMMIMVQLIERRRERQNNIYYIYQTHMEKNTDRHRRRK